MVIRPSPAQEKAAAITDGTDEVPGFREYLRAGPPFDDLDLSRSEDPPREVDWSDPE